MELTEDEIKIIETIRNLQWGRVEVAVKNGVPVMISIKQDVKLDIE